MTDTLLLAIANLPQEEQERIKFALKHQEPVSDEQHYRNFIESLDRWQKEMQQEAWRRSQ